MRRLKSVGKTIFALSKFPVKRIWPIFIVLLILSSSCFDQNDCLVTASNLVRIDLATRAGVAMTTSFIKVQLDSAGSDRKDSVRFPSYESLTIGQLALPLDPLSNTTSYSFFTSDSIAFNVTFHYTTFSRVISTDCGAFLYYQDLKIVKTTFDSTHIVSSKLFTTIPTNVKIMF